MLRTALFLGAYSYAFSIRYTLLRHNSSHLRQPTFVLGSCVLLAACASSAERNPVPWSVGFACAAQAEQSQKVEVAISRGDCAASTSTIYRATVGRGGASEGAGPASLAPGTYAFRASAYDSGGGVIAETCSEIELPSAQGVHLLLPSQSSCQPAIDAGGLSDPEPPPDAGMQGSGPGPGPSSDAGPDGAGPGPGPSSDAGPDGGEPAPGTWLEKSLPYASGAAASAVLSDGLHYLGGSQSFSANVRYRNHYVYDAAAGTWSDSPADVPDDDTWGARAQVYQDRLYLLGGYPSGMSFRVYDAQANAWSTLPSPPAALPWGFASDFIGGVLYAFGGSGAASTSGAGYAYDVAARTWKTVASIPENRGRGPLSSSAVGSRIYVLNGNQDDGSTNLQIYDSATDRWSRGADLAGHKFEAASSAVLGTKVYFFGGANDQDIVDSSTTPALVSRAVNIYDTAGGGWSTGVPMGRARMWSTAEVYDGRFHVLGGLDAQSNRVVFHEVLVQ